MLRNLCLQGRIQQRRVGAEGIRRGLARVVEGHGQLRARQESLLIPEVAGKRVSDRARRKGAGLLRNNALKLRSPGQGWIDILRGRPAAAGRSEEHTSELQ